MSELSVLYVAVMLHETGHFLACVFLKVRVTRLKFMIYGINLEIESPKNPVHSMIISLSGPVVSGLLFILTTGCSLKLMHFFNVSNFVVFLLNIFPALPLDGGVFAESLVSYNQGYIKAHKFAMELTRVISVIFFIFGIIFLIISKYNISLLVISWFLVYNLKEERKKLIFLRHMIYTKAFDNCGKALKVHHKAVTPCVKAISLTDCFGYNFICHVFVYDENMKLLGTMEQSEIIDGIVSRGTGVTVGELIKPMC